MEIVYAFLALGLYLLPWINARARGHHNAGAIGLLNLFLGWTVLGWVIALIWSATAIRPDLVPRAPEPSLREMSREDAKFSLWWLAVGLGIPLLGIVVALLAR